LAAQSIDMLIRGAFRLRYMLSENDLAIIPPKA
jgi:hypothetical protein